MVKGISRQVIVVHAPDPQLFEQAIFILKDDAVSKDGITDEKLMKEANKLLQASGAPGKRAMSVLGPVWAGFGAMAVGLAWLISAFV